MDPHHIPVVLDGAWIVFVEDGDAPGSGGDCYEVRYFGDDEMSALRYCNKHREFRAIYIKHGQSLAQALENQQP